MKRSVAVWVMIGVLLLIALPMLYVLCEGAFYVTSGHAFISRVGVYGTLYIPLDRASERVPGLWGIRETSIKIWQRMSGDENPRVYVKPYTVPTFT